MPQKQTSLELEIKISDKAASSFKSAVENFQEIMQKSGKKIWKYPRCTNYAIKLRLTFTNKDIYNMDHTRITLTIQDLDLRNRIGPFRVDAGDSITQMVPLEIPIETGIVDKESLSRE